MLSNNSGAVRAAHESWKGVSLSVPATSKRFFLAKTNCSFAKFYYSNIAVPYADLSWSQRSECKAFRMRYMLRNDSGFSTLPWRKIDLQKEGEMAVLLHSFINNRALHDEVKGAGRKEKLETKDAAGSVSEVDWAFMNKVVSSTDHKIGNQRYFLIDVREPFELLKQGSIPGAINIPLDHLQETWNLASSEFRKRFGVEKPASDTIIVLFCQKGSRSQQAACLLGRLGVHCANYRGSFSDWLERQKSKEN